MFGNVLRINLK